MLLELIAAVSFVQIGLACLLFSIAIVLRRNDVADVFWGPGIALTGWLGAFLSPAPLAWPHYLMLALITVWALRLALRILIKNVHKPEDPRYAAWRESWGVWFYPRSFVQVFLLQHALMIVLAMSALVAVLAPAAAFNPALVIAGALLWLFGFFFEAVGDYQLDQHIKNPENKGKLMQRGLWRYTRHPNYFGEITMWWGLWVMTLALPFWWVALLSPIAITLLIRFVSGVPMLEPMMEKYDGWKEYKRKTSVLVPWWPKK